MVNRLKRSSMVLAALFLGLTHFAAPVAVSASEPPEQTVEGWVDRFDCEWIGGWSLDRLNVWWSNDVHIYIDGQGFNLGKTTEYRPDVNQAYGGDGNHGFNFAIPTNFHDGKSHQVDVYGITFSNGPNKLIGSQLIGPCNDAMPAAYDPVGEVSSVDCGKVSGWAVDPNDLTATLVVNTYVDGVLYAEVAKDPTPVIPAAYAYYGIIGSHGFNVPLTNQWNDNQPHQVDVYAQNVGPGNNTLLRTATYGPCPTSPE